jgi:hypothetical protein
MNRRTFLQLIGAGLFAASAPEILLPNRTIIDMHTKLMLIEAYDGDDLIALMDQLDYGGTLRVHGGTYHVDRTLEWSPAVRLDIVGAMVNSEAQDALLRMYPNAQGRVWHSHWHAINRAKCGVEVLYDGPIAPALLRSLTDGFRKTEARL